jgi:hypothetical protein
VTNGVNPAMKSMHPSDSNAIANPVLVKSRRTQLLNRDGTMLACGQLGDDKIGPGPLVAHIATKGPGGVGSPLLVP